ncbi:MAG: peptide deformylase [Candidatus Magasanikbacteria bacterium]|nr:peptide deformylase [Candidatus Magasanikbacteria bacterium]
MIYDIVFDPNPILHARALPIPGDQVKTRAIQKFIKDMVETMYVKDGVGLAAVQVGVGQQICTIIKTYNALNPREDLCLINPTWEKIDRHQEWDEEGCLSVPRMYGKIKRYTKIRVKALSSKGEKINFVAEDFFARIIQHECDHLQGHLYIENAKDLHKAVTKKPDSQYKRYD